MSRTLREQLIGTWELVTPLESPHDVAAQAFPLGSYPLALLIYADDGYMSAQLMQRGRAHFSQEDMYAGTPEEYVAQSLSYMAYSGPFDVDERQQLITHSMALALFPNWAGQAQLRVARIDGHRLDLSSPRPVLLAGRTVSPLLRWKRAAPRWP